MIDTLRECGDDHALFFACKRIEKQITIKTASSFGILGYNYDCTDAMFEGTDFDYSTEVPNRNQSETQNPNQSETSSVSEDLNDFLTGGLTGDPGQDSGGA